MIVWKHVLLAGCLFGSNLAFAADYWFCAVKVGSERLCSEIGVKPADESAACKAMAQTYNARRWTWWTGTTTGILEDKQREECDRVVGTGTLYQCTITSACVDHASGHATSSIAILAKSAYGANAAEAIGKCAKANQDDVMNTLIGNSKAKCSTTLGAQPSP